MGKSLQSLVWAENIVRKTNKRVLIVTPLAVAPQFVREGIKFGIECKQTRNGVLHKGISVTNYEQLEKYDPKEFVGVCGDEISWIKNADGKTRRRMTDWANKVRYFLGCTATVAPNDFMEFGVQAEIVGVMTRNQMLGMFFTNDGESTQQWRLKGHAKKRFWQWLSGWAKAVRRPSDLGFDDDGFILPELKMIQHQVTSPNLGYGFLPDLAVTLDQQRAERRRTLKQRCEKVAELVKPGKPFLAWCHLNPEGDLLEELLPDAVQVAGADSDEAKEERLNAFSTGQIRVLVTKPKIGGWGLNWQHCADMSFFPSHSFESFYQAVRRCWRFGQQNEVTCNVVTSQAERLVLSNMQRKAKLADELYSSLVRTMNSDEVEEVTNGNGRHTKMRLPEWLK